MATVPFDYAAFSARFPELVATTPEAKGAELYTEASYIAIGNDEPGRPPSLVVDPVRRGVLLRLITAHLAFLSNRSAQGDGSGAGMVGNIASAGEGSINVAMASYPVGSGKWWEQSLYGAQYWQMASNLIVTPRYTPGRHAYTGVGRRMMPGNY